MTPAPWNFKPSQRPNTSASLKEEDLMTTDSNLLIMTTMVLKKTANPLLNGNQKTTNGPMNMNTKESIIILKLLSGVINMIKKLSSPTSTSEMIPTESSRQSRPKSTLELSMELETSRLRFPTFGK